MYIKEPQCIEEPHARLHATVTEIREVIAEHNGNREEFLDPVRKIYNTKTLVELNNVRGKLREIAKTIKTKVNTEQDHIITLSGKMQSFIIIIFAVSLVLGIGLSFTISRMIVKILRQSVNFSKNMADGDFSKRLHLDRKDEFGMLANSLDEMSIKIGKVIGNMSDEVGTLSSTSNELATISHNMTSGAEQVAGHSTSVAAATEEMSSNMNSVAATSEQASTNVNTKTCEAKLEKLPHSGKRKISQDSVQYPPESSLTWSLRLPGVFAYLESSLTRSLSLTCFLLQF